MFATLRTDEPMTRVRLPYGEPAWLATRYGDVMVVLGDPRFSRAAAVGRDEPRMRATPSQPGSILSLDPPEHRRLRRLVMKAFTVRRINELRPGVQRIAEGFADEMLDRGAPADLVEDFALPLPVTVICELLGVPYEDRVDFRRWSSAFLSTTRFTPDEVRAAVESMRGYMAGLIARRRERATDDLRSSPPATTRTGSPRTSCSRSPRRCSSPATRRPRHRSRTSSTSC